MEAPVELEPLLAFVNTVDLEGGRDDLGDWLRGRGVRGTASEVERATAVREALRALLRAHNGVATDVAAAEAVLSEASRRGRLELGEGLRLAASAGGLDGALGSVLAVVARAVADGSWTRLKACRSDTCRWAFYDAARNRSRAWCDMAVCGNRAKARAFRRRG